jgi:AcrR family transcriptional regulator
MSSSSSTASKRHSKTVRLTRQSLYDLVWSKPLSSVATDLGIGGSRLAKICDRVMVPYPPRGYWAKAQAGRNDLKPREPLPAPPPTVSDEVMISARRAASRRGRTRLSREARADQLIEAAGRIIEREGLHAATMKRVAREIGLSEAQAYNYFKRQQDLLVALARREVAEMNAIRLAQINRIDDHLTRVMISTIIYLRQTEKRGTLIQILFNSPEVRLGLRAERRSRSSSSLGDVSARLERNYSIARDIGMGSTSILTAMCLRAGRLLASKKISLELAERLSLSIVLRANRDLSAAAAEHRGEDFLQPA